VSYQHIGVYVIMLIDSWRATALQILGLIDLKWGCKDRSVYDIKSFKLICKLHVVWVGTKLCRTCGPALYFK